MPTVTRFTSEAYYGSDKVDEPKAKQARRALSLAGLGVDRVNPRAGRGKFIVVMCPCVVVMFFY